MLKPTSYIPRKRQMMRSRTTVGEDSSVPGAGRLIPRPYVPVSPVLSLCSLLARERTPVPSLFDVSRPLFLTAGRMAIAQALLLMDLRPGDKVLLPAFHCAAMVEPLSPVRAEPVFYRLREDLSVDLDDLAEKLGDRVRVVIAANYFGFPNRLTEIREFCDVHGVFFLEDCAHSLFGEFDGRPLGSFGHYAIGSTTKFFPVREGGCLVSRDFPEKLDQVALIRQPLKAQLRQAFDTLDEAVSYGRLGALRPLFAAAKAPARFFRDQGWWKGGDAQPTSPGQLRSGAMGEFDSAWLDIRATWVSEFISRTSSGQHIAERRRRNFEWLAGAFSGYRRFRPLFRELPDKTVPYMFPLYVDDLDRSFSALEDDAVPMLRFGQFPWRGVAADTCRVSWNYSRNLVQFPCHQELSPSEIEAIAARVIDILDGSQQ